VRKEVEVIEEVYSCPKLHMRALPGSRRFEEIQGFYLGDVSISYSLGSSRGSL